MVRWTFYDTVTLETWVVPMNPDAMSSPFLDHNTTPGVRSRVDGRYYGARRTIRQPKQWTFSGKIRTQAHHDTLVDWASRTNMLHVTDHYGRTFAVRIQGIDMQDRKANPRVPWRLRYSVQALSYGVV